MESVLSDWPSNLMCPSLRIKEWQITWNKEGSESARVWVNYSHSHEYIFNGRIVKVSKESRNKTFLLFIIHKASVNRLSQMIAVFVQRPDSQLINDLSSANFYQVRRRIQFVSIHRLRTFKSIVLIMHCQWSPETRAREKRSQYCQVRFT